MKTYLLQSKKSEAQITISYNTSNHFQSVKMEHCEQIQSSWMLKNMPLSLDAFADFKKSNIKRFTFIEMEQDLSFGAFWEAYNYKVGKKKQAENIWKNMSKENRALAISYIKTYNSRLIESNVNKAYPTTYLNQRYYEA